MYFCYAFSYVICVFFFFFFQAEDGIRDKLVTGVQTCALPIYSPMPIRIRGARHGDIDGRAAVAHRRLQREREVASLDERVIVRRRDEDLAGLDGLLILDLADSQVRVILEKSCEQGVRVAMAVLHDDDGN